MNFGFTICSNNYLAQAKTLGDSLIEYNPHYRFFIFLVDRYIEKFDQAFFAPHSVVQIEDIGIKDFEGMCNRYNIVELNTSVKAFIFEFLFRTHGDARKIIYLDPDIFVYAPFNDLEHQLQNNNIVLTPHFTSPVSDNFVPGEPQILNAGLYNLGFIALRKSDETDKFLIWWMARLATQCLIDLERGLFVDQLWLNFVPIYFKDVSILTHPGYNAAYWNLQERKIDIRNNCVWVNGDFRLVFFHFSGFIMSDPETLSRHQNRFSFSNRPDVVPLFKEYRRRVMENNHAGFSSLKCFYVDEKNRKERLEARKPKNILKSIARKGQNVVKAVMS